MTAFEQFKQLKPQIEAIDAEMAEILKQENSPTKAFKNARWQALAALRRETEPLYFNAIEAVAASAVAELGPIGTPYKQ